MKVCPKCGTQTVDEARFCPTCGCSLEAAYQGSPQPQPQPAPQPQPQPQPQYPYMQAQPACAPMYEPENPCDKALGIVAVMCGFLGVIVAYFGGDVKGQRSDYLRFYANEGLVLALFSLISLIPVIGWIWGIFNFVCMIIAIVYACKGVTKSVLFYGAIRIIR